MEKTATGEGSKLRAMKKNTSGKDPKASRNRTRPENKDNLDSRKNEEQDFKGDDVTHNEKNVKHVRPGKKS
jgi:hypothetical protein